MRERARAKAVALRFAEAYAPPRDVVWIARQEGPVAIESNDRHMAVDDVACAWRRRGQQPYAAARFRVEGHFRHEIARQETR
jgi:hypothetical protein